MKSVSSAIKKWIGGTAAMLVLMSTCAVAPYARAQEEHHHHWDADDETHWGTGPEGYNTYYHESGRANYAARRGYAAGYEQGESDRYHRYSYRPRRVAAYRHVPVSPRRMERDDFVREYRRAFQRGYTRAYRRR